MIQELRKALSAFVSPVPMEKRALLTERWDELDPRLREPLQGFGRQSTGCGATIGLHPACDFDCEGCYLGAGANAVPRAPVAEVRGQLRALRAHLGPKGNLQLTDGEVTLLPEPELLATVREACRLGLVPMLMTHGDGIRRVAGLLDRLVEAGLTEIAIHVDSLQRGRRGPYRTARTEAELEPLRDEIADRIRDTRRRTGIRLRAAATLTVARSNVGELGAVVEGYFARRDVFGLVSLQPLARVGRTRDSAEGVASWEVWRAVGDALGRFGFESGRASPLRFGHPDCTRVEPMLVVERRGGAPRIVQAVRPGDLDDERLAAGFLASKLAGLAFRDDAPLERLGRGLGALATEPTFVFAEVVPWVRGRLEECGLPVPLLAAELLRRRLRIDSFQVASHHFMSPEEAATPAGRERIDACVFRVPLGGQMVSMCEANALGARNAYYAQLAARGPARTPGNETERVAHRGLP